MTPCPAKFGPGVPPDRAVWPLGWFLLPAAMARTGRSVATGSYEGGVLSIVVTHYCKAMGMTAA